MDYLLEFSDFDFSRADLHGISARNTVFRRCCFDGAAINSADLCWAQFVGCSFSDVSMRVARIGSAEFIDCDFENADLSYCSAECTSFKNSRIRNSSLSHTSLIKVNFSGAVLQVVDVYGASVWDLNLAESVQEDIIVSGPSEGRITVDNLELAQFIHLLVRNARIRDAIDTITSKVVLILGRFTPERKRVLDDLRGCLRLKNYVPVLFDFDGPQNRDLTETVRTLAHLARFVVVDLTDPKSVPHELAQIVPMLPSVPVQPIIEAGHAAFEMFEHYSRYPWVLGVVDYNPTMITALTNDIIAACERQRRGP